MSSKPVEALKASRAADSTAKKQAVLSALEAAAAEGAALNVSAIAALAGVSRQFIYSHPALADAVRQAEPTVVTSPGPAEPRPGVAQGLKATQSTLAAKVKRQRDAIDQLQAQIAELERQRRRWLGEQLEQGQAVSPEEQLELRLTCDRLTEANVSLRREVENLRRINAILESDLAATRQAHEETAAAYSTLLGDDAVVALHAPPSA